MSVNINKITNSAELLTFEQSPIIPTQLSSTNNNFLASIQCVKSAISTTTNLTENTNQTMIGDQTLNTTCTISSINPPKNTGIQIGNTTDIVSIGNNNSTLSINGILQSLSNFYYFVVGSNELIENTIGNIPVQKIQAGVVLNITSTSGTAARTVKFSNAFTNTPSILITECSRNSTKITPSNHWITNEIASPLTVGFLVNVASTIARDIHWIAVGV